MNWNIDEAVESGVIRPVNIPLSVNVTDPIQTAAQQSLGRMIRALLNDCRQIPFSKRPSFTDRVLLQYLHHIINLFGYSLALLKPAEQSFIRAPLVAHIVRSLVDIYARWLYVLNHKDSEWALRGLFVDSIKTAQLAMEAAKGAGYPNADRDIRQLENNERNLQANRYSVNIVDLLTKHSEYEMLTSYRWESGHVHTGFATIAAHGQTLSGGGLTIDIGLSPLSLWRVGQLTWASYGIALRTVTALGSRIGLSLTEVRQLDTHLRPKVRAAATRARDRDEPISPPYGDFEFPLWSLPTGTAT